jgi:hypothetical protein
LVRARTRERVKTPAVIDFFIFIIQVLLFLFRYVMIDPGSCARFKGKAKKMGTDNACSHFNAEPE